MTYAGDSLNRRPIPPNGGARPLVHWVYGAIDYPGERVARWACGALCDPLTSRGSAFGLAINCEGCKAAMEER